MSARSSLTVVLAAGEGTRMRSARPKVLHAIAGRSLLAHVLGAIAEAGATDFNAALFGTSEEIRRTLALVTALAKD